MQGELHRPLGLDIIQRQAGRGGERRHAAIGGVALIAVLAGSTAAALLQPSARTSEFSMVAAAEAVMPRETIQDPPAPPVPQITRTGIAATNVVSDAIVVSDPGSLRQPASLAYIPDDELIADSPYGPLPVRAADGRRPLDVYAGEPPTSLGIRVAIIVDSLGISQTGTQSAIRELPAGVTLAFSSAGNSLGRWMQEARRGGHELLLQAPMEPVGYPQVSPGPNTLTAADSAAGRFEALHAALGRTTNYVGVMNYMGAQLTGDRPAIDSLLGELGRRGLLYMDDGSSARSLAPDAARIARAPFAVSDILLDRTHEEAVIRRQLDTLERIARAKGSAIGVASAFDMSVSTITAWVSEARERGIDLVPVSALANDPERR